MSIANSRTVRNVLTVVFLSFIFVGCSTTRTAQNKNAFLGKTSSPEVILMPMDIELSVLTAMGLQEPRADWTESAKGFMTSSLKQNLASAGYVVKPFIRDNNDPSSDVVQLEKLHEVVGGSVFAHSMTAMSLPSKDGAFDWSLGDRAQLLRQGSNADYALFVFFRDSFASGGRVATQIGLAMLGVGVVGGQQVGFASLVDVNTGDVVWFNFLNSLAGDSRNEKDATNTIERLMKDFPARQ